MHTLARVSIDHSPCGTWRVVQICDILCFIGVPMKQCSRAMTFDVFSHIGLGNSSRKACLLHFRCCVFFEL